MDRHIGYNLILCPFYLTKSWTYGYNDAIAAERLYSETMLALCWHYADTVPTQCMFR